MIIIKSDQEVDIMRAAGKVTAEILRELEHFIKPGISTMDIDCFVEEIIRKKDMVPSFKGLYDFPASACVSVNEEVVHGIPSKKRKLKEGDIVSVDTGATYKGYVSDAARTYGVGAIDSEAQRLIDAARDSFFEGLKFCRVGYRLSDISHCLLYTSKASTCRQSIRSRPRKSLRRSSIRKDRWIFPTLCTTIQRQRLQARLAIRSKTVKKSEL